MRASRGGGGSHRRWWVATDEPGTRASRGDGRGAMTRGACPNPATRRPLLPGALRACFASRLSGSLIERRLAKHAVGLCQLFGVNESRMGRSGRASGLDCRVPGRGGGATGVRPQDFSLTDAVSSQGWQIGRRHTAATGRCRTAAPEWSTKKPLPAGQPSVGQLSVGKNWGDREGSRGLGLIGGLLRENSARSVRICPADLIVGG